MTGAITWEQLLFFVVLCGALGALWYRVETRISHAATEAQASADRALASLNEFKIQVAREYASIVDIKDVENRVILRLDELCKELHSLRQEIHEAVLKFATGDVPAGHRR
jgi:hypothetical protein